MYKILYHNIRIFYITIFEYFISQCSNILYHNIRIFYITMFEYFISQYSNILYHNIRIFYITIFEYFISQYSNILYHNIRIFYITIFEYFISQCSNIFQKVSHPSFPLKVVLTLPKCHPPPLPRIQNNWTLSCSLLDRLRRDLLVIFIKKSVLSPV